jgi:hypothetical protein
MLQDRTNIRVYILFGIECSNITQEFVIAKYKELKVK